LSKAWVYIIIVLPLWVLSASECKSNSSSGSGQGNDLDNMQTGQISISDHEFEVWVARTSSERYMGLMFVDAEQMEPLADGTRRGMLFIFEEEQELGFWMKNTIIPLDIAYANSNGQIVKTHTMTALDISNYPSSDPAQFALEVNAGIFEELGISEDDLITIPDSLLNP